MAARRAGTSDAARAAADAWRQYASPAEAGFSAERLDVARVFADSVRSGAVMAVYRGLVVAAWGDVSRRIPAYSVRKSLVSALYGNATARGQVRLDDMLSELGPLRSALSSERTLAQSAGASCIVGE